MFPLNKTEQLSNSAVVPWGPDQTLCGWSLRYCSGAHGWFISESSAKVRLMYYMAGMFGIKEWSIEIWDFWCNKNPNDYEHDNVANLKASCVTPSMVSREHAQNTALAVRIKCSSCCCLFSLMFPDPTLRTTEGLVYFIFFHYFLMASPGCNTQETATLCLYTK